MSATHVEKYPDNIYLEIPLIILFVHIYFGSSSDFPELEAVDHLLWTMVVAFT